MKPETCRGCPAEAWAGYMAEPEGSGSYGVLLVGEALGEQEAKTGRPFVGAAGLMLSQLFQRLDLQRAGFTIDNCVRCRPPGNRLAGLPNAEAIVATCTERHLKATVARIRPRAIVALGEIPARHLLGLSEWEPFSITQSRGYVAWSNAYEAWVMPTLHPAFLLRGQQALCGTVIYDIQRAIQIAAQGYVPYEHTGLQLDPTPDLFEAWVEQVAATPEVQLAYDIETPYKIKHELAGEDEGDLEEDVTLTILRIGFSIGEGQTVSIPWERPYLPAVQRLLALPCPKLVWNSAYDTPRLAHNEAPVAGPIWDLMEGWHLLNSALPKRLEFVTPFFAPDQPRWKQLASTEEARYNALDAAIEWRVGQGIIRDLRAQGNWDLFLRHMVELRVVLDEMGAAGMPVDGAARVAASRLLKEEMGRIVGLMQAHVPVAVRSRTVYKRPVAEEKRGAGDWTKVLIARPIKRCVRCGEAGVLKPHVTRKRDNPCYGAEIVVVEEAVAADARIEPFVPSNLQMQAYARHQQHRVVYNEESRPTFNDEALEVLARRYPGDPLYPLVREYRGVERIQSTYIGILQEDGTWSGGMPVGPDGRIHTRYTNNPSTLRLSSQAPNLQNIPRGEDPVSALVKGIFVAEPGHVLAELDYKAIEAVLVGYFAGDEGFYRLATLGVHDYFNGHVLARQGRIKEAPSLAWPEADLIACFADLKAHFPTERSAAKRVVYLSLYGGTPNRMMQVDPVAFPSLKVAKELQALFFEVFPRIRKWQQDTVLRANAQGYLKTPFGNVHRFWRPIAWKRAGTEWIAEWGEEAKAALAFLPQSTAAGVMKEALLACAADPEVRPYLRLTIHDSIVAMIPGSCGSASATSPPDDCGAAPPLSVIQRIAQHMTRPQRVMPVDPGWSSVTPTGLPYLSFQVEAKWGPVWSRLVPIPRSTIPTGTSPSTPATSTTTRPCVPA